MEHKELSADITVIDILGTDDPVMQGARASAAVILN